MQPLRTQKTAKTKVEECFIGADDEKHSGVGKADMADRVQDPGVAGTLFQKGLRV